MLAAIRRFLAEGYLFIGLDHFAREGDELARALDDRSLRRNFMGHTTQAGVDLIGFGPSAISELRASYAQSQREGRSGSRRSRARARDDARLSPARDDVERRWIISRILCHGELRAREFRGDVRRASFAEAYVPELASLAPGARGRPDEIDADGSLAVTPTGRLLVRNLAMAFDAYLPDQQKSGTRIFSKTV